MKRMNPKPTIFSAVVGLLFLFLVGCSTEAIAPNEPTLTAQKRAENATADYQQGQALGRSDTDYYYKQTYYACYCVGGGSQGGTNQDPDSQLQPTAPTGGNNGGDNNGLNCRCYYEGALDQFYAYRQQMIDEGTRRSTAASNANDFDQADYWDGYVNGIQGYIIN